MKRVTKKNMLKYLNMRKEYKKTHDKELLKEINKFIEEVINKDKHYYSKVKSYNFSEEQIKECIQKGEKLCVIQKIMNFIKAIIFV